MGRPPKSNLHPDLLRLLKQIGTNIVELRESQGLTQSIVAQRSKVSVTTLNEIETRRYRDVRLSTLSALASCLGVPVVRLFEHSNLHLANRDQAKLLKASEEIFRITRKIRDAD